MMKFASVSCFDLDIIPCIIYNGLATEHLFELKLMIKYLIKIRGIRKLFFKRSLSRSTSSPPPPLNILRWLRLIERTPQRVIFFFV